MSTPAPGTFVPSIFQFDSQEVRIFVDAQGALWFCAKDVCAGLDYAESSNPSRVIAHVPAEWRGVKPIHTPSGMQEILALSEQGLYFFLGRSDKPKALPFQKWLAGEVLPAIRKTGKYEDEAPSQASDIHFHHSLARLDIELNAQRAFTVRLTAIDEHNVADMLKATACALYELIDQKLPHAIAFQSWRAAA